jgi:hypothetical protein
MLDPPCPGGVVGIAIHRRILRLSWALWGPIPVSRRERAQELFNRANLLTLAAMMSSEGV